MPKIVNCPCCNAHLDGFINMTIDDKPITPEDHLPSMCIHCRTFLMFNLETGIRQMAEEEIVNLDAATRAAMIQAREAFRELQPKDDCVNPLSKLLGYQRAPQKVFCPVCQHCFDLAVPTGDKTRFLESGDVSMCGNCLSLLIVDRAQVLREVKASEVGQLPAGLQAQLNSLRNFISSRKNKQ